MPLPTEAQVVEYVSAHPDCKSKDIAKHFGCTTAEVNRNRDGYRGIYSNPAILNDRTKFTHRVKDSETVSEPTPVPEPVPEPTPVPVPEPKISLPRISNYIKLKPKPAPSSFAEAPVPEAPEA